MMFRTTAHRIVDLVELVDQAHHKGHKLIMDALRETTGDILAELADLRARVEQLENDR